MEESCRTIIDLPNEILESILNYLSTENLLTLQSVDCRWRQMTLQTPSLQRRLCLGTYLSAHYNLLRQQQIAHISYNDTVSIALPWFQPHLDRNQLYITFPANSERAFHFFEHFVTAHPISNTLQDTPLCSCAFPDDSWESVSTCQNQVCWCSQQLTCPPSRIMTFYQNQWTSHSNIGEPSTLPQSILHENGITIGQLSRCVLKILRKWYNPGRSHPERPFCDLIFRQSCWSVRKPSNTKQEREWFEEYKKHFRKRDLFRE